MPESLTALYSSLNCHLALTFCVCLYRNKDMSHIRTEGHQIWNSEFLPAGKKCRWVNATSTTESVLSSMGKMHQLRMSRADSINDPPKTHLSDFDWNITKPQRENLPHDAQEAELKLMDGCLVAGSNNNRGSDGDHYHLCANHTKYMWTRPRLHTQSSSPHDLQTADVFRPAAHWPHCFTRLS